MASLVVVCPPSSSSCLILSSPTKQLQSSRTRRRRAATRVGSSSSSSTRASSEEAVECCSRKEAAAAAAAATRGALSLRRRDMAGAVMAAIAAAALPMPLLLDPATAASSSSCADFSFSPSGLAFCDSSPGSGIQASKGMLIKAHYTGKLESGQVFDSSYNRGKPLTFRIGVGEVIRGWDQGILGTDGIPPMLAGGKRTLRIPPQLAYGDRGAGCRLGSCLIPPNSTLLFEVEFVGKA